MNTQSNINQRTNIFWTKDKAIEVIYNKQMNYSKEECYEAWAYLIKNNIETSIS